MKPISSLCALCVLCALCGKSPAQPTPETRLAALRSQLPALKSSLDRLKSQGQDISYPLVTYTVLENFVNYAEEDLHTPMPDAWSTDPRNTDTRAAGDLSQAHTGRTSFKVTNSTPQSPNVFGMAFLTSAVKLEPSKPYTLSAWVKSDSPGQANLLGGSQWQFRASVPDTKGRWQRISTTFTLAGADASFTPRLVTESPTPGIWLDDLSLTQSPEVDGTKPNLIPNPSFEDSWTTRRALDQIDQLEQMAQRLSAQLKSAPAFPAVPRWSGKHRPKIDGPSFIDPASSRPFLFLGYGHFQQIRTDIPKFPAYGINLVQTGEYGPGQLFPTDATPHPRVVNELRALLDSGRKHGVAVDFLISPHYVPQWFLQQHPHLLKRRSGGFFPYSPYHPDGWKIQEQFLSHVLPAIKDHPALFSVCLTNEPANWEEPSEPSLKLWHAWLQKKHGDLATLNRRWRTDYQSFDDIPQPSPFDDKVQRPSPLFADFVRWNQEFYADWHRRLADLVKKYAPNVPVHAKTTTWLYISERSDIDAQYGLDPTLFAALSDIHGNDSLNHYIPRSPGKPSDLAQAFQRESKAIELLRSIRDLPTFNSENHLIPDRETRPIPPEHVYTALWQAAVRGQSATTLWVWNRTFDPAHDFAGSIMHRPLCAEAVGKVSHDLNRIAPEVRALQQLRPQVLILHSTSAATWDGPKYDPTLDAVFTCLSFSGLRPGFVTERQLEAGVVPEVPVLFVPHATHLSGAAFATLGKYRGRMVLVGDGSVLTRDEYDHPLPAMAGDVQRLAFVPKRDTARGLFAEVGRWLPEPVVRVVDGEGKAVWGVDYRAVRTPAGVVVNVCNYGNSVVAVKFLPPASTLPPLDLLAPSPLSSPPSSPVAPPLVLRPLETKLLLFPNPAK